MADEIREYVRAAQAAEIRGELAQAAELLVKTAHLYRAAGKPERALAMLRHAHRLSPGRRELEEEIRRLEWLPENPMRKALEGDEAQESVSLALSELEHGGGEPKLVERGPALSEPQTQAWCSFCCRPSGEVGRLVAGPAGAFVCQACAGEAARLLGARPAAPGGEGGPAPGAEEALADLLSQPEVLADLPPQTRAISELVRAVEQGRRRILLLGPAGSGKSALLRALAALRAGELCQAAAPGKWKKLGLLLIDGADGLSPEGWAALGSALQARRDPVVLALRGRTPEPTFFTLTGEVRESLPSTQSIITAAGGTLPVGLAEAVDFAASLESPDPKTLSLLALHLLRGKVPDELVEGLSASLAQLAYSSGRSAHELVALARRVPPGAWRLEEPGGYRGRRSPKRKAGPK